MLASTDSSLFRTVSSQETLRDRQATALRQMLHFGQNITKKEAIFEPEWKILIYDNVGKNIISPLLSVKQLHESGVTLFMAINSDREEISDTPAIYLLEPSAENIAKIAVDLKNNMYKEYYFNFTSPIARPQLEILAQAAVNSNQVSNIKKVFDQHMNFISLEQNLFSLKHVELKQAAVPNDSSFYKFYSNKMTDPTPFISSATAGLYAIFATLGAMPIIRASKGHMADAIAKSLDKKFRDSLRDNRATMFMDNGLGFHRPLLIMLDRNIDHSAPLMHNMYYQSLCHDVLEMNLNYVTLKEPIPSKDPDQPTKYKQRTIDCSKDSFWSEFKNENFLKVAKAVQDKVNSWQQEMESITKMKDEMGLNDIVSGDMGSVDVVSSNKLLGAAVASIPEKLKEKESLDYNMSIATALAGELGERDLDQFYELESNLNVNDCSPMEIITKNKGTMADKVRYLLYLILRDVIPLSEIDKYKDELIKQNCQFIKAIDYIKKIKQTVNTSQVADPSTAGSKTRKMLSSMLNTTASVMEGMKQMALSKKSLPVTKLVDQIVDQKDTGAIDIGYWDPKMPNQTTVARSKSPVNDIIVFVVGGGCYTEYIDLTQNRDSGRRIIYGCTDLINGESFLQDLERLGNE